MLTAKVRLFFFRTFSICSAIPSGPTGRSDHTDDSRDVYGRPLRPPPRVVPASNSFRRLSRSSANESSDTAIDSAYIVVGRDAACPPLNAKDEGGACDAGDTGERGKTGERGRTGELCSSAAGSIVGSVGRGVVAGDI